MDKTVSGSVLRIRLVEAFDLNEETWTVFCRLVVKITIVTNIHGTADTDANSTLFYDLNQLPIGLDQGHGDYQPDRDDIRFAPVGEVSRACG